MTFCIRIIETTSGLQDDKAILKSSYSGIPPNSLAKGVRLLDDLATNQLDHSHQFHDTLLHEHYPCCQLQRQVL